MFTVEKIAKDTGLTISFIRKCFKNMGDDILKPHYTKGDCNQILFTESGYVIFDQIKQLKAQGLNINVIKERLERQFTQGYKQDETTNGENLFNPITTSLNMFNRLLEEKEVRMKELAEHQQRVSELERLSDHLKGQLLYITDGKSPEEYKNALHQEQIDKQRLEHLSEHLKTQLLYITDGKSPEEYKTVWYKEQMDKQQLEHQSEHLKAQLLYLTDGRTPEEVKQQWQQEQLDKQRISWLLKEIESLEGIFSIVNYFKRKKLYKELQGLMKTQTADDSTP